MHFFGYKQLSRPPNDPAPMFKCNRKSRGLAIARSAFCNISPGPAPRPASSLVWFLNAMKRLVLGGGKLVSSPSEKVISMRNNNKKKKNGAHRTSEHPFVEILFQNRQCSVNYKKNQFFPHWLLAAFRGSRGRSNRSGRKSEKVYSYIYILHIQRLLHH